jgi:hypothetical protein
MLDSQIQSCASQSENLNFRHPEIIATLTHLTSIMPNDILFENHDWHPMSEMPKGCEYAWANGRGLKIGVFHIGLDQALRDRLDDLKAVRDHYRTAFTKQGMGLIECDVLELEGSRAVRVIGKIIAPRKGAIYVGTLAVPLARESYVFNTLAQESGVSGLRETTVMLKLTKELEAQGYVLSPPSDGPSGQPGEAPKPQPILWKNPATGASQRWCQDPYEPDYDGPCLRNRADAPEHDEKLPEHPLSQVRATLRTLVQDLRFSAELKKRAQQKSRWRFW